MLSRLHERRADVATAVSALCRALTIFEEVDDERRAAFTLLNELSGGLCRPGWNVQARR